MISFHHVSFQYGKQMALQDITLTILPHHAYAVVGPSGCGKSTLLYLLSGLYRPTKGEVLFENKPLLGVLPTTSVVLQNHGLLPFLTVAKNILFVLKAKGFTKPHEQLEQILKMMGLEELKNKYPTQLSGGQHQRAAICLALAQKPTLLCMDEPTSSLDCFTKETVQEVILTLCGAQKTGYVCITHDIEEAAILGQTIIVMQKARIEKIVSNPCFGMKNPKQQAVFYEFCSKIRECLHV